MAHDDPVAGKIITAEWATNLDTNGVYLPELTANTNPNLGDAGEADGTFSRNGHMISIWVRFLFDGNGVDPGLGVYNISLPFAANTSVHDAATARGAGTQIGVGAIRDDSATANSIAVTCQLESATTFNFVGPTGVTRVTASVPFTWAAGDRISVSCVYLADPVGLP